jgi:hypothetical protein
VGAKSLVPSGSGYPLRPEMAESTLMLYRSTGNPHYLRVGESIVRSLLNYTRVPCGFAAVADVSTKVSTPFLNGNSIKTHNIILEIGGSL